MVQIAIMGHGIVGSGVVGGRRHNCESITKRAGEPINIKYILNLVKNRIIRYYNLHFNLLTIIIQIFIIFTHYFKNHAIVFI